MLEFSPLLSYGFLATTALCFLLAWRAWRYARPLLWLSLTWLMIQALLAQQAFYLETAAMPPRILLAIGPPLLLFVALFTTPRGRDWLASARQKDLLLVHVVRIPVELILFGLFKAGAIPELMTFAGRNFDILAGLTAPLVYYWAYVRQRMSAFWLRLWHLVGLALLLNIVIHAILAAPLPFQQLAFDQPNVAVLYYPFIWLPAFVVPVVLLAHLQALMGKASAEEGESLS